MRTCGECTACCVVMGVEELKKAQGVACSNLVPRGCGVYETRPQSCQDYKCLWLQDDGRVLRNMERPDRLGLVLDVTAGNEQLPQSLVARPTRPRAQFEDAGARVIQRLGKYTMVVVVDGAKRSLIGPAHLVEKVKALKEVQASQQKASP